MISRYRNELTRGWYIGLNLKFRRRRTHISTVNRFYNPIIDHAVHEPVNLKRAAWRFGCRLFIVHSPLRAVSDAIRRNANLSVVGNRETAVDALSRNCGRSEQLRYAQCSLGWRAEALCVPGSHSDKVFVAVLQPLQDE
ncbi:hypothetical protein D3C80_1594010 [compost metagenome]